ncbi:MAG TPA: hypothetical protein VEL31_16920 [Ktedonobacteraceae bacterium]|nr:hypothetical protein [Ktedonobacteraceae bacterium]
MDRLLNLVDSVKALLAALSQYAHLGMKMCWMLHKTSNLSAVMAAEIGGLVEEPNWSSIRR